MFTPSAFLSIIFMATFSPVKVCVASLTLAKPPVLEKESYFTFSVYKFKTKSYLSRLFHAARRCFAKPNIVKTFLSLC